MSNSDDIQVVDDVLAGNVDAFSKIVLKYQDKIFRYVYSKCSSYDEALDITQEILIMTIEALGTFRRESKFSTWLYSIMVNYCKNYHKKRSKYNVVSLSVNRGDGDYEIQLPDEREDPEGKVILNDSMRILKDEINKLPDDYREILILRDINGLSYNEIAEVLDLNLTNVKVRIHRGREFLKNRLHSRGLI